MCHVADHSLGPVIDHDDYNDWDDVGEEWLQQAPAYLNATSFLATLFVRSDREMGGTFHASADMQTCLENEEIPGRQKYVAMYLEPAATWIKIGGEKLYRHCAGRSGATSAAAGVLWKGGHPLSLERWSFWRSRFGTLSESEIGDEYRVIAANAAARMEEIEVSYSA